MRSHLKLFLFCLCTLPAVASGEGEVYRWKDATGVWHYSDQPQPGAELVKAARKPAASSPAPAARAPAAATTATAAGAPAAGATANGAPVTAAVAQQVRADAAAAKEEQCRKAKENYDKTVQARRMYKVDEKGERVFLTDAEIDEARLNARSSIDLACGPQ